jgi:hypothetical protein
MELVNKKAECPLFPKICLTEGPALSIMSIDLIEKQEIL